MSSIGEQNMLSLLELGDSRCDVKFRFGGHNEDISGHKLLLSLMSPVFFEQFFGPLSANARAVGDFAGVVEILNETEFSWEAFNTFMRHLYGDKDILKSCTSFVVLFELLQISNHYLIAQLSVLVKSHILELVSHLGHLLEGLEAARAYSSLQGFEDICQDVKSRVVTTFSRLSRLEQKFLTNKSRDDPHLAIALEELLAASGPEALAAMCTNCLRPTDKCAHGELVNQVPHVGMRYRNATGVRQVELVTTTTRSTSSGEPIYDVRVRRSRDGRLSTKHYPTNYRDYYRYHCET